MSPLKKPAWEAKPPQGKAITYLGVGLVNKVYYGQCKTEI